MRFLNYAMAVRCRRNDTLQRRPSTARKGQFVLRFNGHNLRRKEENMRSCAVKIPLIDPIAVECVFWAEDDGWKCVCEDLSVLVRGRDFEESKERMETALKNYVQSLFGEHRKAA